MPRQTTASTAFGALAICMVIAIINTHIVEASFVKRELGDSGTIKPDTGGVQLVARAEYCPGIWTACGDQCPSDAPHFQTRRDCTLADGTSSVEYWCCYES